jgi:hypothetical protein
MHRQIVVIALTGGMLMGLAAYGAEPLARRVAGRGGAIPAMTGGAPLAGAAIGVRPAQ